MRSSAARRVTPLPAHPQPLFPGIDMARWAASSSSCSRVRPDPGRVGGRFAGRRGGRRTRPRAARAAAGNPARSGPVGPGRGRGGAGRDRGVHRVAMVGIGIATALAGGEVSRRCCGTTVLGLFAVAMAGIGIAVGGVVRSGLAGPIALVVTIVTDFSLFLGPRSACRSSSRTWPSAPTTGCRWWATGRWRASSPRS